MRQLNIYELLVWIREYKPKIDDSLVKKVYTTYNKGIILELYKQNLDKRYLYLIPGVCIFLSDKKKRVETDNFAMYLRKVFCGKRINIDAVNSERVVMISENINNLKVYLELFSEGNIVVVDNNDKILMARHYKDYRIRRVFKNEVYKIPPSSSKIPNTFEEFYEIIKNSNKKDIVRCLAIDLKLGGKYAEDILKLLGIEKTKNPKEIAEEDVKKIWNIFQKILSSKSGKIINGDFTILEGETDINNIFEEFYLKYLENLELITIKNEKKRIEEILNEQRKKIDEIKNKIVKYQKIGDFLMTFSWIFDKKNIEKIKEEFQNLRINIKSIKKDKNNLEIEIDENYIESL